MLHECDKPATLAPTRNPLVSYVSYDIRYAPCRVEQTGNPLFPSWSFAKQHHSPVMPNKYRQQIEWNDRHYFHVLAIFTRLSHTPSVRMWIVCGVIHTPPQGMWQITSITVYFIFGTISMIVSSNSGYEVLFIVRHRRPDSKRIMDGSSLWNFIILFYYNVTWFQITFDTENLWIYSVILWIYVLASKFRCILV